MSTPKQNDGGHAFPEHHYFDPSQGQYGMHMTASDVGCGGMTLRDWFAGQALGGMTANPKLIGDDGGFSEVNFPACYAMADAMLTAREVAK